MCICEIQREGAEQCTRIKTNGVKGVKDFRNIEKASASTDCVWHGDLVSAQLYAVFVSPEQATQTCGTKRQRDRNTCKTNVIWKQPTMYQRSEPFIC